jgi:hypothetical protein
MRVALIVLTMCLVACSPSADPKPSLQIPMPNDIKVPNISGQIQPYPEAYATWVAVGSISRGETAEVSSPVRYEPWSIRDPVGWYVCLRRANGSISAVLLDGNGVAGTISPAPAGYCDANLEYAVVTR